ncbi:MAG: hypothetical protein R3337_10090, partial [Gammaproteobacteria bacterium]|nr:hypothetical protein [Gammaproteobacteria bacterium]
MIRDNIIEDNVLDRDIALGGGIYISNETVRRGIGLAHADGIEQEGQQTQRPRVVIDQQDAQIFDVLTCLHRGRS